ncbi:DNA-directed RNA polymerase III subunit RPC7-like [Anabrus simplex]|uniref:DNA-directed RNA polymerase III subunit RPC7-like n=1 Tax=Anabrus simplex TaxID=316456 RepID=UPI0034DD0242
MAGRGRGGAGGRGRGRGSMSFNVEQLGFSAGEALPGPVLQPPPVYPLMENRPAPLESAPEVEYWLALKREYIEFLHDSPAYLLPVAAKADIERYSDRYQALESQSAKGYNYVKYDVKRLPPELRPISKKNKTKQKRKAGAAKTTSAKVPKKLEDIDNRLKELEKNEEQDDEEEGEAENDKDEEKEGEVEDGEEEEEVDEEMDEGTDYANNYFDNGESYIDEEDDNLDDGPVY